MPRTGYLTPVHNCLWGLAKMGELLGDRRRRRQSKYYRSYDILMSRDISQKLRECMFEIKKPLRENRPVAKHLPFEIPFPYNLKIGALWDIFVTFCEDNCASTEILNGGHGPYEHIG